MRIRSTALVASFLAASACAGGAGPSSGPAPLAYSVPQGGAATYLQADSVEVDIDAGGQSFTVNQNQSSTLAMTFEPGAEGVLVTAAFVSFDGRVDNPMAGLQRFDTDDIDGPLVLTLSPTGEATLVSAPEIGGGAESLLIPEAMAVSLFPRLPARAVEAGDTWTDTVSVEARTQGGTVRATSVLEYTARGDTVVDGTAFLVVDFVSDESRTAEIREAGMDMVQDVSGTGRGHFLWDRARNRLHSQEQTGVYTGVMEVPGAPFPLGLSIDAVSRIRIAGG